MKKYFIVFFFLSIKIQSSGAVFTVTDTTAYSNFSLAYAIQQANNNSGKDTITFNIPGTYQHILSSDSLPDITDTLFIDGLSQPGNFYSSSQYYSLMRLVGSRGFTIRCAGCKVEGLYLYLSSGNSTGIKLIADSAKSISNSVISKCTIGKFPIGIHLLPGSVYSLNSSDILIDSVWVDAGLGTGLGISAFILEASPYSDITSVILNGGTLTNQYGYMSSWFYGDALLINRQNNTVANPKISLLGNTVIGNSVFQGYLDSIFISECRLHSGDTSVNFKNCSVTNSVINNSEITTEFFLRVALSYQNFLGDTIKNIRIQNCNPPGPLSGFLGTVVFDFSGNGQRFDSIFFGGNSFAGGDGLIFKKTNNNNPDTVYISHIFIDHDTCEFTYGFNLDLKGLTNASDIYFENNKFHYISEAVTIHGDTSTSFGNIYLRNNTINAAEGTDIFEIQIMNSMDSLDIRSNYLSCLGSVGFRNGVLINGTGKINSLEIRNNSISNGDCAIQFTNQYRCNGLIRNNSFTDLGYWGLDWGVIEIASAFSDTSYSLQIDTNTFSGNNFHSIKVSPSYHPPSKELYPITFFANSISGTESSSGIYRHSQHDTASCMTCIPAPALLFAETDGMTTGINGDLQGDSSSYYIIEFFRNTIADTSGYGEGEFFIGHDTVLTDVNGYINFTISFNGNYLNQFLTATATSLTRMQTSEFSNQAGVVLGTQERIAEKNIRVYPNPFSNQTNFIFSLSKKQKVLLQIFDMRGKLVKELVSEERNRGDHVANFDAAELSEGVYHYHFQSEERVQDGSLVLQR